MRNLKLFLPVAACLCAAAAGAADSAAADGVVAIVGNTSILRSEVVAAMVRDGAPAEKFVQYRSRLIDQRLILRAAAEAKMTMQEWMVDDRIKTIIRDRFDGDRNLLIEALARERQPFGEWRAQVRNDMIVYAMIWNRVDKYVEATPEAMRREYREHPERYSSPGRVSVRVILLKPEDAAKRDEVVAALKREDFAAVAKRYSADSMASVGGLRRDIVPEEEFRPEICAEIAKMPVGTIGEWVEIDGWSFLLRKEAASAMRPRSFAEAYDDIAERVRADRKRELYDAWIERLRAQYYVRTID